MTKVMFALHGDQSAALRSPHLRDELASRGASRLQVNLDDADVAGGMRFGPGEPITAVVSVWTKDVAATTETMQGIDPEVHAYRVHEMVRLDPLPMPEGVRSDVLAQVAILRKPDSMRWDDYLAHWMYTHTAIAIRTQNTSAYVQNRVEEALTGASPEISAIVEEHFPMASMTDPHAFYGSGGDDGELTRRMTELMTSVAAFGADQGLDLVPSSRYCWTL